MDSPLELYGSFSSSEVEPFSTVTFWRLTFWLVGMNQSFGLLGKRIGTRLLALSCLTCLPKYNSPRSTEEGGYGLSAQPRSRLLLPSLSVPMVFPRMVAWVLLSTI